MSVSMTVPCLCHSPSFSTLRGECKKLVTDFARLLQGTADHTIVRQTQDQWVKTELFLQPKWTSQTTFASAIGCKVEQQLLMVPQCFHVRAASMRSERERERESEGREGGREGGRERIVCLYHFIQQAISTVK